MRGRGAKMRACSTLSLCILVLCAIIPAAAGQDQGTCTEEQRNDGTCGGQPASGVQKPCGSCYGAETPDKKCCDTCDEVYQAYSSKKWRWPGHDNVEQCKNVQPPVKKECEEYDGCGECLAGGCAWCIASRRCAKDEPWMCAGDEDHVGSIGKHKVCPSREEAQRKRQTRLEEERKARAEEAAKLLGSSGEGGGAGGGGPGGGTAEEIKAAKQRVQDMMAQRQEEELQKIRNEEDVDSEGGGSEDARKERDELNRKEIERRASEQGSWETKPYDVLGVAVDAGAKEIKKAYRRLSLMLHPDKISDAELRDLAKKAFMDVVAAYEVLGDPDKRAAFDDMGGEDQAQFHTFWEWKQYGGGQKAKDFYQGDKLISRLTESLWPRRVTGKTIWLVEFYTPWCSACGQYVQTFKQIAKELENDDIEVGAVNCETNKIICSEWFAIPSYPSIMLVGSDGYGTQQVYGQGRSKTVKEVVDWARLIASEWKWLYDHSLVDLMHSAEEFETSVLDSLDLWFIVFTDGLHCGPCRTAMTNALRLDAGLNGIAKVGAVDCEDPKAQDLCYKRIGVPTPPHSPQIRIFRKGKKDALSAPGYLGEVLYSASEIEPHIALKLSERVARHALADELPESGIAAGGIAGDFQSDQKPEQQQPEPQWSGGHTRHQTRNAHRRVGGRGGGGSGRGQIGR